MPWLVSVLLVLALLAMATYALAGIRRRRRLHRRWENKHFMNGYKAGYRASRSTGAK